MKRTKVTLSYTLKRSARQSSLVPTDTFLATDIILTGVVLMVFLGVCVFTREGCCGWVGLAAAPLGAFGFTGTPPISEATAGSIQKDRTKKKHKHSRVNKASAAFSLNRGETHSVSICTNFSQAPHEIGGTETVCSTGVRQARHRCVRECGGCNLGGGGWDGNGSC